MKIVVVTVLVLLAVFSLPLQAAEVRNVTTRQVGNRLAVSYDLLGDESESEIVVILKLSGKTYNSSQLHLTGDLGKTRPGTGKVFYWDVLRDFPKGFSGSVEGEVVARSKSYSATSGNSGGSGQDVVYPARNGNIRFSHKMHSGRLECRACHGPGEPGTIAINKDVAHRLCKGCHAEMKAGPTKCGECHKK